MKQLTTTFWISRRGIIAIVAALSMANTICYAEAADDNLFLAAADVVSPAPKAGDPQTDAQKKAAAEADQRVKQAKAEAKKKADALKRRVVVQRAGAVANNKNIEQQIRAQLEPMLKVELSFVIRTAELNDDERHKLIADSKKWFDTFIGPFVKGQDANQQQMMLQGANGVWFGGQAPNRDDPRKTIQAGVAKVVSDTLPKEKRDKYNEEARKREEFVRSVTVDNLVLRVDEKVILSPDQRKKISEALIKHWEESSPPQLEAFMINSSMWPGVPDQWVLPALTTSQQAVLSRINRTSGRVFMGGMGFGMKNDVIDDIDLDDGATATEKKKE